MKLNPEAPEFYPGQISVVSSPFHAFSSPNPPSYQPVFPPCPYYQYQQFWREAAEQPAMVLEEKAVRLEPEVVVGRQEHVEGSRRRNRNKRYGKEGFVKADTEKKWRVKPSTSENSIKVPVRVIRREKHPPIPLKDDGKETTVMIRNIPNRYTREMLKDILEQHCMLSNNAVNSRSDGENALSAFDFLYLPIDFGTKSNKGYAFVNFTNPEAVWKIFNAWHNKPWERFKSQKIRQICCAKLQGREQLLKHFQNMEFPSEAYQPLSFEPAMDSSKKSVKETSIGRVPKRNV